MPVAPYFRFVIDELSSGIGMPAQVGKRQVFPYIFLAFLSGFLSLVPLGSEDVPKRRNISSIKGINEIARKSRPAMSHRVFLKNSRVNILPFANGDGDDGLDAGRRS